MSNIHTLKNVTIVMGHELHSFSNNNFEEATHKTTVTLNLKNGDIIKDKLLYSNTDRLSFISSFIEYDKRIKTFNIKSIESSNRNKNITCI